MPTAILSCQASVLLEDVAAAVRTDLGRGPLWSDLYFLPDRGALLELVPRAETAGYEALVPRVDAPARAVRTDIALPTGIAPVNLPATCRHCRGNCRCRQLTYINPDFLPQADNDCKCERFAFILAPHFSSTASQTRLP